MIKESEAHVAGLALQIARQRYRRDYVGFQKRVLGIDCRYNNEPAVESYHREIGDLVNYWHDNRDTLEVPIKCLVVVPRKTFKTAGISEVVPVYTAVKDPNLTCGVMCASYKDLAVPIAENIRAHFEGDSPTSRLKAYYGDFHAPGSKRKWSGTEFTIDQRTDTKHDQTVSTYGARSGSVGHHFDIMINDDLVTNEAMRNNSDWLDVVWKSWIDQKATLNPNALVFVIMTRYHDADLAGRIIENEIEPGVKRAFGGKLPQDWSREDPKCLEKYGPLAGWNVIYRQACENTDANFDEWTFNFPGIWSKPRVQEVLAGTLDDDSDGDEYNELFFHCQLQNTPQKRKDNPIKPIHIKTARGFPEKYSLADVPRTGFVDFHCDFAFKDARAYATQSGDFSVIHVCVKENGFVWRVNGYRGKPTQDQFGKELIHLAKWARNELGARVRFLSYDKITGQGSGDNSTEMWLSSLFRLHPSLNTPVCLPIKRGGGKSATKAQGILDTAWAWQESWVRLVDGVDGVDELCWQMGRIGYTKHDDDADAFADSFHKDMYKVSAMVHSSDRVEEDSWKEVGFIGELDEEYEEEHGFESLVFGG